MDTLGIWNSAIGRIGLSAFIQALDERSNQAITCNRFYEGVRDRVLSEYDWGFAKKYSLAQDIGSPPTGWNNRFQYPNDCLAVREVLDAKGIEVTAWQVVDNEANGGLAIVVNYCQWATLPLTVRYTARVVNPGLFSSKFTNALIWCLAAEVAGPLSAKPEYVKMAGDAYVLALLQSGSQDLNERKEAEQPNGYVEARQ